MLLKSESVSYNYKKILRLFFEHFNVCKTLASTHEKSIDKIFEIFW